MSRTRVSCIRVELCLPCSVGRRRWGYFPAKSQAQDRSTTQPYPHASSTTRTPRTKYDIPCTNSAIVRLLFVLTTHTKYHEHDMLLLSLDGESCFMRELLWHVVSVWQHTCSCRRSLSSNENCNELRLKAVPVAPR